MLRKRLIASFFMITPVLILLWLDTYGPNGGFPGLYSVPVIALAGIVIAGELMAMLREQTPGAIGWVAYVGVLACHVAMIAPEWTGMNSDARWWLIVVALTASVGLAFANELLQYREGRPSATHIAITLFVIMYAGWMLSFLSAIRLNTWHPHGVVGLFAVMFIIKMSDAGAYFAGKNLGKRKLAPVLSPGKTVEGLVGGVLAAIFAGWIVFAFCYPEPPAPATRPGWLSVIGYAVTICLVGVVGDLSESLIKRDMGVKDSSGWLPGLGGIMDTADSVLLAAPVAYLWWTSGLL